MIDYRIVDFLKHKYNVFQDSGNELIIHCPYCDDALRKNAGRHGHLYISKENPVFHCFRCNTSGYLGNLLIDIDFDNNEVLSQLKTKSNFIRRKSIDKSQSFNPSIYNEIFDKTLKFKNGNYGQFEVFYRYINSRIGTYADNSKYLFAPSIINNSLAVSFYNSHGNFSTARVINVTNNKIRYIREKNNTNYYYFQNLDLDKYRNIVICEGAFDIIGLHRFSLDFNHQDTFFMALLGKNYIRALLWLAENFLLIGSYNINFIFDKDNSSNAFKTVRFAQKIVNRINPHIKIFGFNSVFEDVGLYPAIIKI